MRAGSGAESSASGASAESSTAATATAAAETAPVGASSWSWHMLPPFLRVSRVARPALFGRRATFIKYSEIIVPQTIGFCKGYFVKCEKQ